MSVFKFRHFAVCQSNSALKVGTDAMILGALIDVENKKNGLDIGAGTGVLSLMVAQRNPIIQIDAVEMHSGSVKDADLNFTSSPYSPRLTLHDHDFLHYTSAIKYDLIFSNPPFYETTLKSGQKDLNHAKHVSELSPEKLFSCVGDLLSADGTFWLIWPHSTMEQLVKRAEEHQLFAAMRWTIYGKPDSPTRVVIAFVKDHTLPIQKELIVRNETGLYTPDYVALTKEFHDRDL